MKTIITIGRQFGSGGKEIGIRVAKALGIPPFALTRLSRQVGRRSYEALKASVSLCVETDYDIKRGALREDAALDRLMLLLAGEK